MLKKITSKVELNYSFSNIFLICIITICFILLIAILWKTNNFYQSNVFETLSKKEVREVSEDNSSGQNYASVSVDPKVAEVNQIVVLFSLTFTILFILAVYLFGKIIKNRFLIKKSQKNLKLEKHQRKKTELQLFEVHNILQTKTNQLDEIIEGTTDLIAAVDLKFNLLFFNKSFLDAFSRFFQNTIHKGDNIIDKLFSSEPEKAEASKNLWQRALNGEKFTAEQNYKNEFDDTVFYELTYTPILNESGSIIGATQIARDITQRKIEASETENERNFVSAVVDASSSLVIVLNREGRIVKFNKASEVLTGFDFEEVQNKIIWDILIPTHEIRKIKQSFRTLDSKNFDGDYLNPLITKDEIEILISWKVSTIKDETDQIQFIVATGIDVTEKEEFEKSRNRMLDILENSRDFIGLTDITGNLKYLNKSGKTILNLTENVDVEKLKLSKFVSEESAKILTRVGIPISIKTGSWVGEVSFKTEDKEVPVSLLLLSHKNKIGEVEFLSTVARDISDLKEMKSQLQEARDSAVESSKLKSDFLANMSHEIRTPMNGVIGMTELLNNSKLDESQKDIVETIQTSGDALLTIINDILDFSKVEAGKLKFENVEFNIRKTVEEVVKLFSKQITSDKLELLSIVYNEVPNRLFGDPGRLRQVLTNLVGNALKFTEEGEIIIRVRVIEKNDSTVKLKFFVKDTGVGIEKDFQEKLFGAFTQADDSVTRRYGGTGLGLAISKNLVNLMNGEIDFESEYGKGSEFWFTSEFEIADIPETGQTNEIIPTKAKVLIVDDNKSSRHMLLYYAKSIGIFAEEAESPEIALKVLQNAAKNGDGFDYIFLDNQYFTPKGYDLVEKLKTLSLLKNTKPVLLLNKTDLQVFEQTKDSEVENVIYKPIIQTLFQNKLKKLIGIEEEESAKELKKQSNQSNTDLFFNNENNINSNYRILIAEDNLINQKVILSQLSGFGFEIELVSNGKEVLKSLETKQFSLILMDCQMPLLDGLETTKIIRNNPDKSISQIPIIAVTAHAINGDKEKYLSGGMNDYISKPTSQKNLITTLRVWLNKSQSENFTNEISPDSIKTSVINETSNESHPQSTNNIQNKLNDIAENSSVEVVIECIDLFLTDNAKTVDNVGKALKNSDYEQILLDAHKLKGSSANMGATILPEICQQLIASIKNKEFEKAKNLIEKITVEYNSLVPIYKSEHRRFEEKISELSTVN